MEKINLSGMSANALTKLAERASALAKDLRKEQPSYELALEAGVKDKSYLTVREGLVNSYSGEAVVTMADGRRWVAGESPIPTGIIADLRRLLRERQAQIEMLLDSLPPA